MFTCDHCEEKFEDKKEMQRHVTKHKQDEPAEAEQHAALLQELHQEEQIELSRCLCIQTQSLLSAQMKRLPQQGFLIREIQEH